MDSAYLRTLSSGPGVYRMLDAAGEVLYVGKARNLKRRVSSYFRATPASAKTMALVSQVVSVEVTLTHTETEALILENNLIKQLKPRYNVLLRDDKSYPWIYVSTGHKFPRLVFHRGPRRKQGRYFGPYPSVSAARETIQHLQKLFMLRNCEDNDFASRSRPCLQYQIRRCSAPCVGLAGEAEYRQDVEHALLFLEGRNERVIEAMAVRMEAAAGAQDYELAARHRDLIAQLQRAQERQHVSTSGGDLDVIAVRCTGTQAVAAALFIRSGRVLGHRDYFPQVKADTDEAELAAAFLAQYYLGREAPAEIVVSHDFPDRELLERTLSEARKRRVRIRTRVRGERASWLESARTNADHALALRLAGDAATQSRLDALREALALDETPQRIECFDASHTMGEGTVVSCVVFGQDGPQKSQYRRFNVTEGGDDTAALREAVGRRYARLRKGEAPVPDMLLVDGGAAQLAVAEAVLTELGIDGPLVVAVAKGGDRRPGQERLFLSGRKAPLILGASSAALHLVQQIRDEAHRFAITAHRLRRAKSRTGSVLDAVAGLGPKRRQALLREFGGMQAIARAGVEDLARVRGISHDLAQRVYDMFHEE